MNKYDVYAFGMVSSSTLFRVKGPFPAPEGYAEIDSVEHVAGGEAANSSIVLSRLGARTKLDGNWIGADDGGQRTKALLTSYQIDTSRLNPKEGYRGASEIVFTAGGTRTIFGTYGKLLEGNEWNAPHEDDVRKARVVCLDPFFREASYGVAETAFDAGIPVVTVDCGHNEPLLGHASAIIISESYIRENYSDCQLEDLFRTYQHSTGGLVIFTFGDAATWYARPGEAIKYFEPYSIEAVDTTGGGDAFRAGIVYGFMKGWADETMIEFAAAVAAINCTRFPGVMNAPTYDEVVDFIRERKT